MAAMSRVQGVATFGFVDRRSEDVDDAQVWEHLHLDGGVVRRTARLGFQLNTEAAALGERDGVVLMVALGRAGGTTVERLTVTDSTGRELQVLSDDAAREALLDGMTVTLDAVLRSEPSELDDATTTGLCAVVGQVVRDALGLPADEARRLIGQMFRWSRDEALGTFGRILDESPLERGFQDLLPDGVDARALLQHALLVLKADAGFRDLVVRLAAERLYVVALPYPPAHPHSITVSFDERPDETSNVAAGATRALADTAPWLIPPAPVGQVLAPLHPSTPVGRGRRFLARVVFPGRGSSSEPTRSG